MNLTDLNDDESWERAYQVNLPHFAAMAGDALTEHQSGLTEPLEDLLGE